MPSFFRSRKWALSPIMPRRQTGFLLCLRLQLSLWRLQLEHPLQGQGQGLLLRLVVQEHLQQQVQVQVRREPQLRCWLQNNRQLSCMQKPHMSYHSWKSRRMELSRKKTCKHGQGCSWVSMKTHMVSCKNLRRAHGWWCRNSQQECNYCCKSKPLEHNCLNSYSRPDHKNFGKQRLMSRRMNHSSMNWQPQPFHWSCCRTCSDRLQPLSQGPAQHMLQANSNTSLRSPSRYSVVCRLAQQLERVASGKMLKMAVFGSTCK